MLDIANPPQVRRSLQAGWFHRKTFPCFGTLTGTSLPTRRGSWEPRG